MPSGIRLSLALLQCGTTLSVSLQSGRHRWLSRSMDTWCDVAEAGSLAPGNCRTVEARGLRIALARLEDGFHAVEDACPHRGGSMGSGFLDGCTLHCPLHGWAYDVSNGAGITRPDKPLRAFPTRIQDGRVWVQLTAQLTAPRSHESD